MQVNLLPWRQRQRQVALRRMAAAGMAAALACLIAMLVAWQALHQQTRHALERQEAAASQLRQLTAHYTARQALVTAFRQQAESARRAALQRQAGRRYVRLLQELETMLPPDVWLVVWQEQGDALRWQGRSRHYEPVMQFVAALRQSHEVHEVRVLAVHQQPDGLLHFDLQATWRPENVPFSSHPDGVARPVAPAAGAHPLPASNAINEHRGPGRAVA
ncbi:PilN domain-containing protein [Nissabacter sp. SGAir0207]|uniref:PilN domain-containing protein n=1 Tax=Nissabacter sp. SGAir0207 TaxID=2126321 RepID=UPI001F10DE58|nr:PilN domain-containing protein [Nissabacter sp. SGAir0207]